MLNKKSETNYFCNNIGSDSVGYYFSCFFLMLVWLLVMIRSLKRKIFYITVSTSSISSHYHYLLWISSVQSPVTSFTSSSKQHFHRNIMTTSTTTTAIMHSNNDSNDIDKNSTSTNKIAVAQLCSTSSKYHNLINIAKCAGYASKHHCSMLFLPECFGCMSENSIQTLEYAEPTIDDSVIQKQQQFDNGITTKFQQELEAIVLQYRNTEANNNFNDDLDTTAGQSNDDNKDDNNSNSNISLLSGLVTISKASKMWISAGGMHVGGAPPPPPSSQTSNDIITTESSSRVYNTHIIIDNHGMIQTYYRKIHLFDVLIPNQVNLQESKTTAPGTKIVVCDSPIGRLGLSVCYDLRFPETYIELVKQGAQILLVPSAFTVPTGKAHWHTLLQARAIENQCYVIAAAQYGKHNEKRESYGHSLVIDPWGQILADAGGYDGVGTIRPGSDDDDTSSSSTISTPSVIMCEIDLKHLQTIRQRMPIQTHRANASFL